MLFTKDFFAHTLSGVSWQGKSHVIYKVLLSEGTLIYNFLELDLNDFGVVGGNTIDRKKWNACQPGLHYGPGT